MTCEKLLEINDFRFKCRGRSVMFMPGKVIAVTDEGRSVLFFDQAKNTLEIVHDF